MLLNGEVKESSTCMHTQMNNHYVPPHGYLVRKVMKFSIAGLFEYTAQKLFSLT